MSDVEQDQIIGRTFREHQAAKQNLAALEAKSAAFALHMRNVAGELFPPKVTVSPDTPTNISKCPDRDELTMLLADMAETRKRVNELAAMLLKMGVSTSA